MSPEMLMRVGQFMLVAAVAFAIGTFLGREYPSDRAVAHRINAAMAPAMKEFQRSMDELGRSFGETPTPTPSP